MSNLAFLILAPESIAQQPIKPVPMTPFADGANSLLNEDLHYRIGDTKFTILVPSPSLRS